MWQCRKCTIVLLTSSGSMCTVVHKPFVCKRVADFVRKWKAINWYSWYMKTAVFCSRVWIFANGRRAVKGRCAPINATSEEPTCIQEYLSISVWWSYCGWWKNQKQEEQHFLTNGGVVTLVLQWCLTSAGLMSNYHRIADGLCCTLSLDQGRVMAIVEKLGLSKANAVWVHQRWQTQKEEKNRNG